MALSQHRRCVKLVAAFLSGTFFFTQIAFAHLPSQAVWDARRQAQKEAKSVQLAAAFDAAAPSSSRPAALSALLSQKLSANEIRPAASPLTAGLPLDAVTVRQTVSGSASGALAGRRLVIVQDVHMNGEAQSNVAKLLFSLMDADRAGLVAVEGAVGRFELEKFRSFPDKTVTRDVARAFFAQDRMAAPSFAGLTAQAEPPLFIGVDDAAHYEANVDAYLRGARIKTAALDELAAASKDLGDRKKKSFPTALAALDGVASAYARGERSLGEHLQLLDSINALSVLDGAEKDNARRFLDAWKLERRLDFGRAEAERRAALEKLVAKLDKGEIDSVVNLSLAYRNGAVSYGDYHRQISSLFTRHGISLESLPAFRDYLRYVSLSDGISGDVLLEAARRATAAALDRGAATPEQKKLVALSRRLDLKRKLVDFTLTPAEWTEYAAGGLEPSLAAFEDFYREAHVRSERMVESFAAAAKNVDASKTLVLIIGGFHAPEVAERLHAMGASYALVSPKLTKVEAGAGSAYLSVFSREKTPLDRLFAGEKLTVYPADRLISAVGPRTAGPNAEFATLQQAAAALRGGAASAIATVDGRTFRAVGAGASIPFGYRVAGQETVGGTVVKLLSPSAWRSALSRFTDLKAPVHFVGSAWDRAVEAGLLTRETAAKLSFLEELLYTGFFLLAVPYLLMTVGGVPAGTVDLLRPVLLVASAALFAATHTEAWGWSVDGRLERLGRPVNGGASYFVLGLLFRGAVLVPGLDGGLVLAIALAGHAAWSLGLTRAVPGLAVAMMSADGRRDVGEGGDAEWISRNTPSVAGKNIVEVTMEMALSGEAFAAMERAGFDVALQAKAAMATSTGGIGPLLKERVIALGSLGANVTGVSLLYEHVWVQRVEKGRDGQPDRLRQEKVRIGDAFRSILEPAGTISVEMFDGGTVQAKVWKAPAGMYGKAEQYFLDAPAITDVVYPGKTDAPGMNEAMRLAQNWLVGRGTLELLKTINRKPDVTIMSEMPSTLVQHRLVEDKYTNDPFFNDTMYVFNDHTPLEYAHPLWDAGTRQRMRLRDVFWRNLQVMHDDRVDGTAMIINMMQNVGGVFGVAAKHADVMRGMEALKPFASKIDHVTNGVSGAYWPTDEFANPAAAREMDDDSLLGVKDRRREKLLRFLADRQGLGQEWADKMIAGGNPIGIWTRRIVEYKRMNVFADLLENPELRDQFIKTGIIFVIGGRIHQDDNFGLIQYERIQRVLAAYPELKERFIFFDNYNIREAPMLFQGADFSVMLADDGQEASATGFQKAQMNGDAVIASHDGAVPESVVFQQRDAANFNGFEVPYVEVQRGQRQRPTAPGLMNAFGLFNDAYRNRESRATMIRNALSAAPRVDVLRTVKDMLRLLERGLRYRQEKAVQLREGRDIARLMLEANAVTQDAAAAGLATLNEAGSFGWKYKAHGVTETQILESARGLRGFIDAFHVMDDQLGTTGEWSLLFHVSNHRGRGDVIAYLETVFKSAPELKPFLTALEALGERSRKGASLQERVSAARVAVGFADEVLKLLEERATRAAGSTPAPSPAVGRAAQARSPNEVARVLERFGILPKAHVPDPNWTAENAPHVAGKRIVEVTMEMALSGEAFEAMERAGFDVALQAKAAMATSTGGIGPLLKERVIALGDLGAKVVGVSLLYEHVWVQRVEKGSDGQPDRLWQEKVRIGDAFRAILEPAGTIEVEMYDGSNVVAKVWRAPPGMYGQSTQYFIDYPPITDVVYPGKADAPGMNEAMRLSQNWLVGRGTLQLLKQTNQKPDVTIMSEMPSTLVHHRLVEDKYTHDPFFDGNHYVFNDHTPLEYAHPKWDEGTRNRMRLRDMFWKSLNVQHGDTVDGTAMLIGMSDQVYGVAEKHARVMRAMEALRQFAGKIDFVTNGVSAAYWPSDELRDVAAVEAMPDAEVNGIKDRRRAELIRFLAKRQGLGDAWAEKMIAGGNPVGIWTRRIVEYKRMNVFADLLENPEMREQFIRTGIIFVIGGRIHQDDNFGLIQYERIQRVLAAYPELKERFVFFDNFNIREAPALFRGADFSVMLADDGQEASATGFQKEQMNGGAVIASHDGAVPESVIDARDDAENFNGFLVPYVEVAKGQRQRPTAGGLLEGFQRFDAVFRNSSQRARMIRNAVKAAPRVDVMRTAKDMLLFLEKGLYDRESKDADFEVGRRQGAELAAGIAADRAAAGALLGRLADMGSFDFRYKAGAVEERTLFHADGGVQGFLRAFRLVEEIGTGGDWSLRFHVSNQNGRGDILAFLQNAFGQIPELASVNDRLAQLAERSQAAISAEERVSIARTAIGLVDAVVGNLEERSGFRQPVAPGLVGLWSRAPGLGFAQMTAAEGAMTALLLVALTAVIPLFFPAGFTEAWSFGDAVLGGVAASGWSMIVTFFGILAAHGIFGVLQPDRSVSRELPVIGEAVVRASSSLLAAPFVSLSFVLFFTGHLPLVPAVALLTAGFAVAIVAHLYFNREFIRDAKDLSQPLPSGQIPLIRRSGPLFKGPVAQDGRLLASKDPAIVFSGTRYHLYGTSDANFRDPYHAVSDTPEGPYTYTGRIELMDAKGDKFDGRWEAPGVVYDAASQIFHMYVQTTFNSLGGKILHFDSRDGRTFTYRDEALSADGTLERGLYDPHPTLLPDGRKALVYAAMKTVDPVPDPDLFIAISQSGEWSGPWERKGVILRHEDVPFHNVRGSKNQEWGLEGPQILAMPDGHFMLLFTAFLADGKRGTRQRVAAAFANRPEGPYRRADILLSPKWDSEWAKGENGHASGMIVPSRNGTRLYLYYQARAGDSESQPWNVGFAEFALGPIERNLAADDAAAKTQSPDRNGGRKAPLGLIGLWSGQSRLTVGWASVAESIVIAAGALMAIAIMLGQSDVVGVSAFTALSAAQAAARLTMVVFAASFPWIVFLHLALGVMQPNRTPAFGASLALRAGAVASVTLAGVPFIAFAVISWLHNIDLAVIGFLPLIAVGLALGAAAHRLLNLQILERYGRAGRAPEPITLNPRLRARIETDLGRILQFLSIRDVVTAGPDLESLRQRQITELPASAREEFPAFRGENAPKVDAIFILGSHFLDVPVRAARLYLLLREKNPDIVVVFAGGIGPRTSLRFPYWSSEAELFGDSFREALRMQWYSGLERRLREAFKPYGGRYTGIIVQIGVLIDQMLRGYRGYLPKKILYDTRSTNTGQNIENITRLFRENGLAPENILTITAGVFELRSSRSILQQYPLPFERLYSWAATKEDPKKLSDADLVDLANVALGEFPRIRSYVGGEKPFMIPTEIPEQLSQAEARLRETLEEANLVNFTAKAPASTRKTPSLLVVISGLIAITTLVAMLPSGNPYGVVNAVDSAFRTATSLTAGGLVGQLVYAYIFAPTGLRASQRVAAGPGRTVMKFLQVVLPVGAGGLVATLGILGTMPIVALVLIALGAGALLRAWVGSVEHLYQTVEPTETPGAAGFWSKTRVSLPAAGALEGVATVLAAASVMGLVAAAPLLFGDLRVPALALFSILSATGLAIGAGFLTAIHRVFGVTLPGGGRPAFDRAVVNAAIRTSYLSLLGVPLIAAAFVLPAFPAAVAVVLGLAAATIPHAAANARATSTLSAADRKDARRVGRLLRDLQRARDRKDDAGIAAALSELVRLERLGLDSFGRETSLPTLTNRPAAFAEWRYETLMATRGDAGVRASSLGYLLSSNGKNPAGDLQRRDHIVLVPSETSPSGILREAQQVIALAEGRPVKIILPDAAADLAGVVRAALGDKAVVLVEADLRTPEAIRDILLDPARRDSGRLKLLIARESGLPELLMQALLQAGKDDPAYRDLVDVVIVTALSSGAFAIRAALQDIERTIEYRNLVMTQA